MRPVDKWLCYYSPLFRGRFDFFRSDDQPEREAWHQGLGMSGGRFWMRRHGGHDLRRRAASTAIVSNVVCDALHRQDARATASSLGVLVGRADGSRSDVTTFPWVPHSADREYLYALAVVGAGGVADEKDAPILRLSFDSSGDLIGPAPHATGDLIVEPIDAGNFQLRWTYDETDEEAPAASFQVFNDAGSPGIINTSVVVATVPYHFRQAAFRWTSDPFAHDQRIGWAVRAIGGDGVGGPISAMVATRALAFLPPAPADVRIGGID